MRARQFAMQSADAAAARNRPKQRIGKHTIAKGAIEQAFASVVGFQMREYKLRQVGGNLFDFWTMGDRQRQLIDLRLALVKLHTH